MVKANTGLSGLSGLTGSDPGGGGGGSGSSTKSPATAVTTDPTLASIAWSNPTNVLTEDATYASVTLDPGERSQWLDVRGFQFAATPGTLTSLLVEIKCKTDADEAVDLEAYLLANGANPDGTFGDNQASGAVAITTTEAYLPSGGYGQGGIPAAVWNADPTYLIGDANFGFRFSVENAGVGTVTVRVNHIRMTVTW